MAKRPLTISAQKDGTKAVIRIDGYITSWNNHAAQFKAQIDDLIAAGIKDATVYINSGGGDCFQANEIANEIVRFPGKLTAKLGALCASAGTYIACKCDYVISAKNISYMIHKPMGSFEGNADQVKAELKVLENLQGEYLSTYSGKTGIKEEKLQSMWANDYWMNASEAKTLGFIDEVEGEAAITDEDVQAISAYKNAPVITATTKISHPKNNSMKISLKAAYTFLASFFKVEAKDQEIETTPEQLADLNAKLGTLTSLEAQVTTLQAEKQTAETAKATAETSLTAEKAAHEALKLELANWKAWPAGEGKAPVQAGDDKNGTAAAVAADANLSFNKVADEFFGGAPTPKAPEAKK
ncbi:MAG: head maturation protease, ClpP-related [Sediminibacterium sp.]